MGIFFPKSVKIIFFETIYEDFPPSLWTILTDTAKSLLLQSLCPEGNNVQKKGKKFSRITINLSTEFESRNDFF